MSKKSCFELYRLALDEYNDALNKFASITQGKTSKEEITRLADALTVSRTKFLNSEIALAAESEKEAI